MSVCTDRGRQIRQRREGKKKKNRKVKKTAAASKPKSHKAPAAAAQRGLSLTVGERARRYTEGN